MLTNIVSPSYSLFPPQLFCYKHAGVDTEKIDRKDSRGINGYFEGIFGNPSLVQIQTEINEKTKKTKKN